MRKWEALGNYVLQEKAIVEIFAQRPTNQMIEDVLIKVCLLNDFYSTNILDTFRVAKHILNLDIDKRLKAGDLGLINNIAIVTMKNGKSRNFYSFASKYCSHHQADVYAIFDSFVQKDLLYFAKKDKFCEFKRDNLKNYKEFSRILREFIKFYNLKRYSLRQIDQYLWLLGKEYL
ncbi:hypothetical protein [Campylobacter sp.]|uniref:hypothetical protein n=1 Tax=Campylobacter sp. TaxID=205 RepID=UPI0025B9F22B|nr:hypothetical protein [Campylobacter sp.]